MNDVNIIEKIHFTNELWVFIIPAVLMAVDILTGSLNAWAKHDFKSFKMRQGLVKKCGELIILALGEMFTIGMGLPKYLIIGISAYIIFMELISVCENLDKMGVPIPKFISKALSDAQHKIEDSAKDKLKDGEKDDSDTTDGNDGGNESDKG